KTGLERAARATGAVEAQVLASPGGAQRHDVAREAIDRLDGRRPGAANRRADAVGNLGDGKAREPTQRGPAVARPGGAVGGQPVDLWLHLEEIHGAALLNERREHLEVDEPDSELERRHPETPTGLTLSVLGFTRKLSSWRNRMS